MPRSSAEELEKGAKAAKDAEGGTELAAKKGAGLMSQEVGFYSQRFLSLRSAAYVRVLSSGTLDRWSSIARTRSLVFLLCIRLIY